MALKGIIDQIKTLDLQDIRRLTEEYCELVFLNEDMEKCIRILTDSLGPPFKPAGEETTKGFISGMVTSAISEEEKNWIIERNFTMPRAHAATLLYNHSTQDWRDTIPRINIPTLIISGRVSLIPWKSQVWIHEQIAGSKLEIFEEEEGGQHFMFIEGAEKFNQTVADFIG